jgi:hypothetical protein
VLNSLSIGTNFTFEVQKNKKKIRNARNPTVKPGACILKCSNLNEFSQFSLTSRARCTLYVPCMDNAFSCGIMLYQYGFQTPMAPCFVVPSLQYFFSCVAYGIVFNSKLCVWQWNLDLNPGNQSYTEPALPISHPQNLRLLWEFP